MPEQPVCAIAGMGKGIGLAAALKFAGEGFRVAMLARRAEPLAEFEKQVKGSRGFAVDLADEAPVRNAFERIETEMGAVSVLIYNASAHHAGRPTSLNERVLVSDFRVNAVAPLWCVQEVLDGMIEAGRGTILLTGGGLALKPQADVASLSIGKAAIRSLALSLAQELGPVGIHVATVSICGFVQPGTPYAAEKIVDEFWRLHCQPTGQFEAETVVQ